MGRGNWRVWAGGVLATAVGVAATSILYVPGVLVLGRAGGRIGPAAGRPLVEGAVTVLALAAAAVIVGLVQRCVLQRRAPAAVRWLVGTGAGWAVVVGCGLVLAALSVADVLPLPVGRLHGLTTASYATSTLRPAPPAQLAWTIVAGAVVGSVVGAAQWAMLRRSVARAWPWIVTTSAGWALGWAIVPEAVLQAAVVTLQALAPGSFPSFVALHLLPLIA